ncbi:MAG: hypothetical protein ACKOBC_06185 [Hyphomicrobiales bacterium]
MECRRIDGQFEKTIQSKAWLYRVWGRDRLEGLLKSLDFLIGERGVMQPIHDPLRFASRARCQQTDGAHSVSGSSCISHTTLKNLCEAQDSAGKSG